uniref:Uncharacterized protein n=1 Tax=Arundo donax TaxID=35708 RepID=A0A0A9DF06_ARUDO
MLAYLHLEIHFMYPQIFTFCTSSSNTRQVFYNIQKTYDHPKFLTTKADGIYFSY